MRIIQNAAFCKECGQFIVSNHVHDFNVCSCGAVSVDGGGEYLSRNAMSPFDYDDFSVVLDDYTNKLDVQILSKLLWGTYGKTGEEKLHYRLIKDLTYEHLTAILEHSAQSIEYYHLLAILHFFFKKTKIMNNQIYLNISTVGHITDDPEAKLFYNEGTLRINSNVLKSLLKMSSIKLPENKILILKRILERGDGWFEITNLKGN